MRGHVGQGLSGARSGGGFGKSSKLVRLRHDWRSDVPMQSVPVSPPPITMTSLPSAESAGALPSSNALVLSVRYSMAKCTPGRSRPSMGRSRGTVAPVARSSASLSSLSFLTSTEPPLPSATAASVTNSTPSSHIRSTRRSTVRLSSFMLGMPYISSPPIRSSRS